MHACLGRFCCCLAFSGTGIYQHLFIEFLLFKFSVYLSKMGGERRTTAEGDEEGEGMFEEKETEREKGWLACVYGYSAG